MSQPSESQGKKTDPVYGRRNFLKHSAISFGITVQEYVKHRDAQAAKAEKVEAPRTDWLRPPGAIEEPSFLERCIACGDCIDACPHQSVQASSHDGRPVIFADHTPCYVCEDFPCIAACETEALLPIVGDISELKLGTAKVNHRTCMTPQGCNACVSKCPMQAIHMDFASFSISVEEEKCVGCGICEYVCKSVNDRIAIKVEPVRFEMLGGGR